MAQMNRILDKGNEVASTSVPIGKQQDSVPLDWGFLAGFFDASGSLFYNWKGKPRLRLSSYNHPLLKELRDLIGNGSLSSETRGKKTYFRLEIRGHEGVYRILKRISPYLRVKSKAVEKYLFFAEERARVFEGM